MLRRMPSVIAIASPFPHPAPAGVAPASIGGITTTIITTGTGTTGTGRVFVRE